MDIIDKLTESLKKLPTYIIELGVTETNKNRKKFNKIFSIGVTNAELMFIHEYGSLARHIPARPVLQMTIDWVNNNLLEKVLNKCMNIYLKTFDEKSIENELSKLCVRMENYAKDIIYSNDGRLAANSPKVAEAKRQKAINNAKTAQEKQAAMNSSGNHPLFDTGQLARSITCRLVVKK